MLPLSPRGSRPSPGTSRVCLSLAVELHGHNGADGSGGVVGNEQQMWWRRYWQSWEKCEELVRSSWRLTQSILLIGTVLPLILAFVKFYSASRLEPRTAAVIPAVVRPNPEPVISLTDSGVEVRPLLPYSVIPGGARNSSELRAAIAHDPLVATHYLIFDVSKTHVVRLDRDSAMYVSYRMGEHVYWTRKKLVLLKGETLLTDGQHLARTRCGNRLSETPELPTSLREPERAELETPPAPELAEIMAPPVELPLSPIGPLTIPPPETPGHIFFPPIIPIWWGSGTPPTPGVPVVPPPPPPPPVKRTPEPATALLLCAGLGALRLMASRRR